MASNCRIPSNPDVSGIGIRIAIYVQNILCFVPALCAIWDGDVDREELESAEIHSTTNLVLAFAILISCIFQALARGLSNYHSSIVLSLSWMNNTNAFVYFLLYVQSKSRDGGVEPKLTKWWEYVMRRVRTMLCLPDSADHGNDKRKPSVVIKDAGNVLLRRVPLFLGSIHFTLMSALGIWLWSSPQTFGTSDTALCITQSANLTILGIRTRLGSPALRIVSLAFYSLVLVPGVNLIIPVVLFMWLHCWYHTRRLKEQPHKVGEDAQTPPPLFHQLPLSHASDDHQSLSQPAAGFFKVRSADFFERIRRVLPVYLGLVFLLAVNIILIVDTELTIQGNKHLQNSEESQWGFGQILALLLLSMPLRDVVEALFRRRQAIRTKLNRSLKDAIRDRNWDEIVWCIAKADPNVKSDDGQTALEVATVEGKWPLVRNLIQAKANVRIRFRCNGSTVLEAATLADEGEVVEDLVRAGVKVAAKLPDGRTILEVASLAQRWRVVRCLVKFNADVNIEFTDGTTAFEVATLAKQWLLISDMLECGADVKRKFRGGQTVLEVATVAGEWSLARLIVQANADVKMAFKNGATVLEAATMADKREIVEDLIKAGVDVTVRMADGRTVLELATLAQSWNIVRSFVRANADVNTQFSDGSTAFEVATLAKQWSLVQEMLQKGADVEKTFKGGRTALEVATMAEEWQLVRILVQAKANVKMMFASGTTALEAAVLADQWGIVEELIKAGVDVQQSLPGDRTMLEMASLAQSWPVVRSLVRSNADVNVKFADGTTALEVATLAKEWLLVDEIIQNGADIQRRFKGGQTALGAALLAQNWSIVRVLVKGGAKADPNSAYETAALEAATLANEWEVVENLISAGANVKQSLPGGRTLLEIASLAQKWRVVLTLIKANADIDVVFSDGTTAFEVATLANEWQIVQELIQRGSDIGRKFKGDQTALEVVVLAQNWPIVRALVDAKADVNTVFADGTTVLEVATLAMEWTLVPGLIEAGADFGRQFQDDDTKTLIHAVCHHKKNDLLKLLLGKGVDCAVTNSGGRTAYDVAMQAQNIDGAILVARKVMESHPAGPSRPSSLRELANALVKTRSLANRRESIRLLREALELLPPDDAGILTFRHDLADALQSTASSVYDRDVSISLFQEALELRSSGHPDRWNSLDDLACALLRKGTPISIRESYALVREAVSHHSPSGDNSLRSLQGLDGSLRGMIDTIRSKGVVGRLQDIQAAILLLREALEIIPASHSSRGGVLQSLAISLHDIGSVDSMGEAIRLQRKVVELRSPNDQDLGAALSNLAYYLAMMYDATGVLSDLEESVVFGRRSLSLSRAGIYTFRYALANLAFSLHFFPENKDEALAFIKQVIPLWPSHVSAPFDISRVLSHILFFYYEQRDAVEQLRDAAVWCERALSFCSPDNCCRPKLIALKCKIDTALPGVTSSEPVLELRSE